MKKIFELLTVSTVMIILGCVSVNAETYKSINVVVNGKQLTSGILKDSRTLIQVRGVFDELGYSIEWKPTEKVAYFTNKNYLLTLQSGNSYFKCKNWNSNKEVYITPDVPQQIIDGHFYIPLRAVSESIGAKVSWEQESYTASISTDPYDIVVPVNSKDSEKSVDLSNFKSSAIQRVISEKNVKTDDDLGNIYEIGIYADDLNMDMLDDLKYFPNLNGVYIKGDVSNIDLLKTYYNNTQNKSIAFYLEKENFYDHSGLIDGFVRIDNSDVSERIESYYKKKDYEKTKKDIISKIIKSGDGDFEKILAIHDYIVLNTEYDYENYKNGSIPEESYDPYYVLKTGKGVCEGYAKAMKNLLETVGIETYYVTGEGYSFGNWGGHGWIIVKLDGAFYHIDPTWDDPVGMSKNYYDYDYFLKGDAYISKDHNWNTSDYPACRSDYNYESTNKKITNDDYSYDIEDSTDKDNKSNNDIVYKYEEDDYSYNKDKESELSEIYDVKIENNTSNNIFKIVVEANEYTEKVKVVNETTGDSFYIKSYTGSKKHIFEKEMELSNTGKYEVYVQGKNADGDTSDEFDISLNVQQANDEDSDSSLESPSCSFENDLFDSINSIRRSNGLEPLNWSNSLENIAKLQCNALSKREYSSYDFLDEGRIVSSRYREKSDFGCYLVENIAFDLSDPNSIVVGLMDTEINSCHILNEDYNRVGIKYIDINNDYSLSCVVLCFDN